MPIEFTLSHVPSYACTYRNLPYAERMRVIGVLCRQHAKLLA